MNSVIGNNPIDNMLEPIFRKTKNKAVNDKVAAEKKDEAHGTHKKRCEKKKQMKMGPLLCNRQETIEEGHKVSPRLVVVS